MYKEPQFLQVPFGQIKPWGKNPRGIKKKDIDLLAKSIHEKGQFQVLTCWQTGDGQYETGGGNMRWHAMREVLHYPDDKPIWISLNFPESEKEKIELSLLDNMRFGYYEEDKLAELVYPHVEDIRLEDFKVDVGEAINLRDIVERFGPDIDDGADDLPDIDNTPAITKTGDLFTLGKHRLLCGDSTKRKDVERLMAGKKADLCFTSPPYFDARDYGGSDLIVSHLADFIVVSKDYARIFAVNLGIIRRNSCVIRYWDEYIARAESAGLKLLSWNVWNRGSAQSIAQQTAMFPVEHEWVLVFGESPVDLEKTIFNKHAGRNVGITDRQRNGTLKHRPHKIVGLMRTMGTVFTSPPHKGKDIGHPAIFPIVFADAYIQAVCAEGEVVLDPFLGSGTTLIAAEKTGRVCYGMEIDPKYCDVIIKRYADYVGIEEEIIRQTREGPEG